MVYSLLVFNLRIPGCHSLKQKRSFIKPLLIRLHKEFNISTAEIEKNDIWDESIIACGLICNEKKSTDSQLSQVVQFMEKYWKEVEIINYSIQFL